MNRQLDSLFSPEKLNKRWEEQKKPSQDGGNRWQKALETTPIQEELSRISAEIMEACRTEKQTKVMGMILSDIQRNLAQMDARDDKPGEDEVFALIEKIQQLEDLVDAYMGTIS